MRFDLNGTLTSAISGPEDVAKPAADLAKSPEAVKVLKDKFDFLEKLPAPAALVPPPAAGAGAADQCTDSSGALTLRWRYLVSWQRG